MIMLKHALFLTLIITLFGASASAQTSLKSTLPIEAHASLANASQMNLSPNGNKVAFVQNGKGTLFLVVFDLTTGKKRFITKTDNLSVTLNWFDWLNNDVLLMGISSTASERGIRYKVSRLLKFDLRTDDEAKNVIRIGRKSHNSQFQDNVISMLSNDPEHVLLSIDLDTPNKPSVYKLNVLTGKRKRLERPKKHIDGWIADRQGKVRIMRQIDDTFVTYSLKDLKTNKWKKLFEYEVFSANKVTLLGFDKNPNILYFKAIHKDKDALFKMDVTDPEQTRELVYHDENYDVDGSLVYSEVTNEVVGFSHSGFDDLIKYWDEDLDKLQRSINKAIPDSTNVIIDTDVTGQVYILYTTSNDHPGAYLLGDRNKSSLEYIISKYPLIEGELYNGKNNVEYIARDKTKIEGYLTFPADYQKGKAYPAIILPHGGPMARDYAGFDYWSEFFSHHGYLVFQPNFRGSSGYGFSFESAAIGGWGEAMQDDLQDAASWLVAQGYTKKDKMCIAGGSYGGYASLMALVKHPDTFQCAASFAGVADLNFIYYQARNFTNKDIVRKQIGTDRDQLEQVSPINFAEKFTKPVLLIHGSKDSVVSVRHSREMAEELEDANKDVKYIELEDGSHYLVHQPYRVKTLQEMLVFFNKHLM